MCFFSLYSRPSSVYILPLILVIKFHAHKKRNYEKNYIAKHWSHCLFRWPWRQNILDWMRAGTPWAHLQFNSDLLVSLSKYFNLVTSSKDLILAVRHSKFLLCEAVVLDWCLTTFLKKKALRLFRTSGKTHWPSVTSRQNSILDLLAILTSWLLPLFS
jgi:hypothetical protein